MNFISVKQVAKHLAHSYGTKAPEVIKLAKVTGSRWPVLGKRLVDEFPYIEAEIRYGVQEYACTIVDFLARRTRLAFLNAQAAADAIPKIADIMAKELNWSKAKKEVMLIYLCKPVEGGGAGEGGRMTQRAKKVVSDSPGLVDFAIGLVNSVFNLPDGQVMFFEEFE